jgi:uncharacterized spore protein YtfJ
MGVHQIITTKKPAVMEYNLNEMITKLTDFIKSETKTETVIGQPFELGGFKCVPVIGLGFGLGVGGGEGTSAKKDEGTGMGGGAGIGIGPIGFLVTKDDKIEFISTRKSTGLGAAFEKLPELLERFMEKNEKHETAKA